MLICVLIKTGQLELTEESEKKGHHCLGEFPSKGIVHVEPSILSP
jgi:hypothetical protein